MVHLEMVSVNCVCAIQLIACGEPEVRHKEQAHLYDYESRLAMFAPAFMPRLPEITQIAASPVHRAFESWL